MNVTLSTAVFDTLFETAGNLHFGRYANNYNRCAAGLCDIEEILETGLPRMRWNEANFIEDRNFPPDQAQEPDGRAARATSSTCLRYPLVLMLSSSTFTSRPN